MNAAKIISLIAGISCIGFIVAIMAWNLREFFSPTPAGSKRRFSGWIPIWKLFAPGDVMTDYSLLARAHATDDWSSIFLPEARRWYHFFWNPKAELNKYVSTCAAAVQYPSAKDSSTTVLARQMLLEFACVELETEDAELLSAINVGTVTDGIYRSAVVRSFSLTSSSQSQ